MEDQDSQNLDVSFIIPLLNEKESLEELTERIIKVMDVQGLSYEIIFVDDGSSDGSAELLMDLSKKDPSIILVSMKRNFGKSNALMVGFNLAKGERAITMDADLQDKPENLPHMLDQTEYDLVNGWRENRHDSWLKKTLSIVFNRLVDFIFSVDAKDINCGFKIYKKELYKSLNLYGDLHRMTLVLANLEGFTFKEVAVEHAPRKHGQSKYPLFRARGLWDILSLSMMKSLKLRPFHFFAPYSIVMFTIAFFLLIYIIVDSAMGNGGYSLAHTLLIITTLLGASFFIVGLQLEAAVSVYMKDYPFKNTIKKIIHRGAPQDI